MFAGRTNDDVREPAWLAGSFLLPRRRFLLSGNLQSQFDLLTRATQESDVCQENNGGREAGLRQQRRPRVAAFRNAFAREIYGQERGFFLCSVLVLKPLIFRAAVASSVR